ncbi:unnamed protein product, partial [Musa textilis]
CQRRRRHPQRRRPKSKKQISIKKLEPQERRSRPRRRCPRLRRRRRALKKNQKNNFLLKNNFLFLKEIKKIYRPVAGGPRTGILSDRYVPLGTGSTSRYCRPC